jgi:PAS domain S-box-containing protein
MTDRRRRQRRTERLIEESEEVISVLDPDGNFEYVGGSAGRVMGYEKDQLTEQNFFDTVHPDDREGVMEAFFGCVEDTGSGVHRADCRLDSGDEDDWMNAELRYRNMVDDEAIDGVVLYILDVTETKERARRFEAIFNSTFQFIGLLDVDGTVVEVNQTALDFIGSERQDVVGEPFWEGPWWGDSEEKRRRLIEDVEKASEGDFVRHEIEAVGEKGLIELDFSIRPVTDEEGEVVLLIPEGREITDKKRQRQHLQVLQRVMRHNMRNDLNKVGGFVDLLAGEDERARREEYAGTVENVLGKWESMSGNMERIRKIVSTPVEEERTEAGTLVERAVSDAGERYPEAGVSFEVPEDLTATVPTVMRDGVDELIRNAVEASREEGGSGGEVEGAKGDTDTKVNVSVSASSDWVEIQVSDNGPGMPEIEAKMLEEGEETPLEHGRGMGLWMVRMAAIYSGGEASVETTPEGTTVTLRSVNRRPEQR